MPHQPFPARQFSRIGFTPDEIPPKVCARRAHRAASLTGRLRVDDEQPFHNPVKEGLPTIRMVKTLQALADCEFGWGF
jgi:hypothetical protein